MYIYSKEVSERLSYITHHIFERILGIPFEICTDISEFENYHGYKINYSDLEFENVIRIVPHRLLFEKNIVPQPIDISIYKDMPFFFTTKPLTESFLFDVFAACFYFLSRYEEYLPYSPDEHQRFTAGESLAYKHNFLHLAVVDRWIEFLKNAIKERYPDIVFAQKKFSFIPTYDVDIAYAYRCRGFFIQVALYIRSFFRFDFKDIIKRTKILSGRLNDPYNTFHYWSYSHWYYKLEACYFLLAGEKRTKFDRNTSCRSKTFKDLIRYLDYKAQIGLHASYYSKDNPKKIDFEKGFLEQILGKKVVKNRNHYLRFSLPETYQMLASKGIEQEYSMGYVKEVGFRAGTCNPFLFFDLQNNKTSQMEIYPFLFMENALSEMKTSEEILQYLAPYIDEVKRYNGVLVSIFHNQTFDNEMWKEAYKELLKYINSQFDE